jgi:hypothetical protein
VAKQIVARDAKKAEVLALRKDQAADPHSLDLATEVVVFYPQIAGRGKVTVTEATNKSYSFTIFYPDKRDAVGAAQTEATKLIRAMLRKLLADGQQPSDQKINIWVWVEVMEPGLVGETKKSEPYKSDVFRAVYWGDVDAIEYEECWLGIWSWGKCDKTAVERLLGR